MLTRLALFSCNSIMLSVILPPGKACAIMPTLISLEGNEVKMQ